jgi:hypothetical protein
VNPDRVHYSYQYILKRNDVDETQTLREVVNELMQSGRSYYPKQVFDAMGELITKVDYQKLYELVHHPLYRRCVDEVKEKGIDANLQCHRVFELLARWNHLWTIDLIPAYRILDFSERPVIHEHDDVQQP